MPAPHLPRKRQRLLCVLVLPSFTHFDATGYACYIWFVLVIQGGRVVCYSCAKGRSSLRFAQLWDEEEEEDVVDLPTMGAREPFISEDPVVLLEDIFRDLHQEGQQINMASPEVAEEDLPEESPVMPVVTGPSSVFNISPTRQTSSSSSHHYAKLLSVRIVQPSEGAPISGNLSLDSHPFFMRLLIRAIQSLFITGSYLSRVTSSRCAQFHGPS